VEGIWVFSPTGAFSSHSLASSQGTLFFRNHTHMKMHLKGPNANDESVALKATQKYKKSVVVVVAPLLNSPQHFTLCLPLSS
jgi:hypothetical protein